MAHAPTPGVSSRAESSAAAKQVIVVRLERTGEEHRLAMNNLPLEQRAVVLREVKVSFDAVMASGDGILAAGVCTWLSRRIGGERALSWQQFQRQWPADLTEDDLDVWLEDPHGRRLNDDGVAETPDDDEPELEGTDPQS